MRSIQPKKIRQYVGLDVHKKTVYGYVMDEQGNKLFAKEFKTLPHELDKFLLNVMKEGSIIAIESCSCWQYVWDYLTDAGYYNKVLAHPVGVKALKKLRKHTDKDDAKLLADLLRTNMLPLSYAAPWDIRVKRQITRHRHSLTDIRTQIKNKIKAILLRHGMDVPFEDAFCKSGIRYLQSLDLPSCDRFEVDNYLELILLLEKQRKETTESIEQLGSDDPAVRLAMTMTGMAYYNATTFVAEVGDIRRFKNGDKVASFTGLTPKVHQSGERTKLGHITKRGNNSLRWVMIQAANNAVQHDKTLKKIYLRLVHKKGHQKAVVAVARRMVTLLYTMLKHNIPYHALQIHKAS